MTQTIPQAEPLRQAIGFHQEGRWAEAEAAYRAILAAEPAHPDAHHNLGVLLTQFGRIDLALGHFEAAHAAAPESVPFRRSLIEAQLATGSAAAARRVMDEAPGMDDSALSARIDGALGLDGRFAAAVLAHQHGHLDAARQAYDRILAEFPDHSGAHHMVGVLHYQAGRLDEAVAAYEHALSLLPRYSEALSNLGLALQAQGRQEEAAACLGEAIAINPGFAEAHQSLGSTLHDLNRLDEAVCSLGRAIEIRPDSVLAHNTLGTVLRDLSLFEEAVASYRTALALQPDFAMAYRNLANTLRNLGRLDEAEITCRHALSIAPDFAAALCTLGNIFRNQARFDEAVASFRAALALDPEMTTALNQLGELTQHSCAWGDWSILEEKMLANVRRTPGAILPFTLLTLSSSPAEQLATATALARMQTRPAIADFTRRRKTKPGKIRLGYLSGDFHGHAVAYLMVELIERHDRERFEVRGYSFGPDDDSPVRRRLMTAFDRFTEIAHLPDAEAAKLIADDKIDILIDLKGHTQDARTEILGYRPAPVQVNFLGYPGTMGAPFMDYIIGDAICIPEAEHGCFSESVVTMPDCYQPNDRKRPVAEVTPSRAACGLPEHAFVFCCFNDTYKITPDIFHIWMRLLGALPHAVLWLLKANPMVCDNLRREAAARGIDPDRLIFAPRLHLPEHLARHRLADLFLDTLPYNAHTTASDALWVGLPLVTCRGHAFPGRVAASLLTAVGLPELITGSLTDYHALALNLAKAPKKLAALRKRLERNRATAPLFDSGRYTRSLETAYGRMWETFRAGRPPEAIDLTGAEKETP